MKVTTDLHALEEVRKRRLLIDRYDAFLISEIQPYLGKRVLEVGCGLGNLIPNLLDRELVVATDFDTDSIDEVRRRFESLPNVRAAVCDITATDARELKAYACDTVISLNALEHIEDDQAALKNIASILAPRGRLILIVPAFQILYGRMDASIGHYRRYSQADLALKLEKSGLQIVKQYYSNVLGAVGWFVNGRILRRTVPPSSQLRLYNLVFPISSKLESLLPRVAGLSLISISQRA